MKKFCILIMATYFICLSSPELIGNTPPEPIRLPDEVSSENICIDIDILFPEQHPATHSKKASYAQLKKERKFEDAILEASDKYSIDAALIKAVIMAESGYNTRAVSKVGARGLMQLMPKTAESLGVEDIYNPEQNIDAGVKYLKELLIKYNGNIDLALAAYNAGLRNVRRYKGVPPFKATKKYIRKVEAYQKYYRKQLAWDLNLV